MLAKVCSAAVSGIEAYPVEVEVNAGYGDTTIVIVGLPDAAVKESRDRVVTALMNSGYGFTFGRTTVNLAPADVKKEGPSFDLPIAIGMLAASEQVETDQLENFVMVGELALNGPVPGIDNLFFAVTGKYQYTAPFVGNAFRDHGSFFDGTAKLTYKLGSNTKLLFSGILNTERSAWGIGDYVDNFYFRNYGLTGYVTPEWRRKGIGRKLLAWLEEHNHPALVMDPIF